MKNKKALLLSALVLLSAQAFADQQGEETYEPIQPVVQCPSASFGAFLGVFIKNVNVQKTFTHIQTANGQVTFPVMPNAAQRKADGTVLKITRLTAKEAQVTLSKPETDFKVVYFFQRKGCWQLVRIEDLSG